MLQTRTHTRLQIATKMKPFWLWLTDASKKIRSVGKFTQNPQVAAIATNVCFEN